MLGRVLAQPSITERLLRQALQVPLPNFLHGVVVVGMGGSGMCGDLLATLADSTSPVPVVVHKDYGLPKWVGRTTLVVAVSYSGETEETLDAAREALRRDLPLAVMTRGGALAQLAMEHGVPLVQVQGPKMLPRAALPFMVTPLLQLGATLGLVPDPRGSTAALHLRSLAAQLGPSVPFESNPAKQLAGKLLHATAAIYGHGPMATVAQRWRAQLNENAKVFARDLCLPEMNHNDLVPWPVDKGAAGQHVVLLRHQHESERVKLRFVVTEELGWCHAAGITQVGPFEGDPLAALLGAIFYGDLVSVYLAGLRGVDPSPVEAIAALKGRLGGSPQ